MDYIVKKVGESYVQNYKNRKIKDGKNVFNNVTQIDNLKFNEFLKVNKEKINTILLKDPPISKDDEWRNEDLWND